jgi:hypothetical protein
MNNDVYCSVCNVWLTYGIIVKCKGNGKGKGHDKDKVDDGADIEYLIHCPDCHRIWDGNAQCPCLLINKEA